MSRRMTTIPTLTLVRERKIGELMSRDKPSKRWEASGVLVKDGHYFVVFDNRTEIARIVADLQPHDANGLFGMADDVAGYEGITYNAAKGRYYLLVEAREHARGCYQAVIVEYDDDFNYHKARRV